VSDRTGIGCRRQCPRSGSWIQGRPEPRNIDEIAAVLRSDPYDLELLISYGTSKGGSGGHLALALRDELPDDDLVYSANYYADRTPEHEKDFYTADLMTAIPKKEYLWKTSSSLGDKASFGLDFGESYKRSVIGIRVYGVPAGQKRDLIAFFRRVNDDYHARRSDTDYQDGEVVYGYLDLNCAKTIGMGFKRGAGYEDLVVKGAPVLAIRKLKAALKANIPTEMAMKLVKQWVARGYRMDVVLYRKYDGSTYVDPHEEEAVEFRNLPDRFPSVLSRDFRREGGAYKDYDNLYAMYLLDNMRKYTVTLNDESGLEIANAQGADGLPRRVGARSEKGARRQQDDPQARLVRSAGVRHALGALREPHQRQQGEEDQRGGVEDVVGRQRIRLRPHDPVEARERLRRAHARASSCASVCRATALP
jgi:hypothetical protein